MKYDQPFMKNNSVKSDSKSVKNGGLIKTASY